MVAAAWQAFAVEIARWKDLGRVAEFWWRDDDASSPSAALSRLYSLAFRNQVPLALAAVPDKAEPAAFEKLPTNVTVIQHGTDHRNRATGKEKKTEFSLTEPAGDAVRRLVEARDTLERMVGGGTVLRVLAPPWNRVPAALVRGLSGAGYIGLSTFGPRKMAVAGGGPTQINTHVDIIDWKGDRGFCGVEAALAQALSHLSGRRTGIVDVNEPTGWLSHHAVHDEQCWDFLERLFEATQEIGGVRWCSPISIFTAQAQTGSKGHSD